MRLTFINPRTKNETILTLHFHHSKPNDLNWRSTSCRFHFGICTETPCLAPVTFALCNPKDMFVKERGRKISLTRALSSLPKDTRKAIWRAYHEHINFTYKGE
jgi:hypothetical protein